KDSENALIDTLGNFWRSLFFMAVVFAAFVFSAKLTWFGLWMAVLSGAVASGIGYAVWYAALNYHSAARAAVLQLSVPLIAAAGGVVIVAESLSSRLPVASILILGGIMATIVARK
ncbi:MAG: DMT family transporter, partial [Acidobacteriota bacterium]|nr:DMT family transporter [Acidobacteriota bacterium]